MRQAQQASDRYNFTTYILTDDLIYVGASGLTDHKNYSELGEQKWEGSL